MLVALSLSQQGGEARQTDVQTCLYGACVCPLLHLLQRSDVLFPQAAAASGAATLEQIIVGIVAARCFLSDPVLLLLADRLGPAPTPSPASAQRWPPPITPPPPPHPRFCFVLLGLEARASF